MTDSFARATAKRAHHTAADARELAQRALDGIEDLRRRATIRPRMFVGRCSLCGDPCSHQSSYCAAHKWAA